MIRSMRSFFLPFSFFLCGHITSCIRDSRSFARRFAPSNDVRCGTSLILLSPTKKKTSCDLFHGAFFLTFFLFLCGHITSCIRDSRSFARRFAPSNDVRCGTSLILLSPTKKKTSCDLFHGAFFLTFFLFLCGHITSCIRDSRSFARRFAPSNDVRCGTSSILLSPTIMKSSTCSRRGIFYCHFY